MTELEEQQENKNKRIAFWSTAAIQVVVTLLLFIIIAWRAPDPPLPEYGIELNFGMDTEGSGDIQPETPVGNEGNQPEEATQQEPVQAQPEVKEEVEEETKPADTKEVEEEPVSKVESPVVTKEKEPEKPEEKPKEKVEEKKVEKQPEVKPEVKKEQPKAVFKPSNEQATAEKEGSKEGTPGSHGDDKEKTGDKGNPAGNRKATDLYGKPGGGGNGPSVTGFDGFEKPVIVTPELPDGAFGVYEFTVRVDDQGEIVEIKTTQRGLSIDAEKKLKEAILRAQFIPKGDNTRPFSEGKIVFSVVAR